MLEENTNVMNEDDGDLGTVTLELDDDRVVECDIVAIFPNRDKQYIALSPMGEEFDEEPFWLYEFVGHGEDEEPDILPIFDEDELEDVCDAFSELMETMEGFEE